MCKLNVLGASLAVIAALVMAGCGQPKSKTDDAPFRQAIDRYLDSRNMAMAINEIKEGPTVTGQDATLQASLFHRELKGPSVTWTFHFRQSPGAEWSVTRHEER